MSEENISEILEKLEKIKRESKESKTTKEKARLLNQIEQLEQKLEDSIIYKTKLTKIELKNGKITGKIKTPIREIIASVPPIIIGTGLTITYINPLNIHPAPQIITIILLGLAFTPIFGKPEKDLKFIYNNYKKPNKINQKIIENLGRNIKKELNDEKQKLEKQIIKQEKMKIK